MSKLKKLFLGAALLTLSLTAFAGCGSKKEEETGTLDKNTVYSEEAISGFTLDAGFVLDKLKYNGEKVYYLGYLYDSETYAQTYCWGTMNTDGTEREQHEIDVSDNSWIDYMTVLSNGNVVLTYSEYVENSTDPENPQYEQHYYLKEYDLAGNEVASVDMYTDYGVEYISNLYAIPKGGLIVFDYSNIYSFDNDLKFAKKTENPDSSQVNNFYTLRDGSTAASMWTGDTTQYFKYDVDSLTAGEALAVNLSTYTYGIVQGTTDYDFLATSSSGIFGYNVGDADATPILNYVNSDIDTYSFSSFVYIGDDTFIACYNDYDAETYESTTKVNKYVKVDPSTIKDKKTLTLGCFYTSSDLRKDIIEFNKTSDEYRIVITDYSQYDSESDWNAGTTKFNTDIVSGNAPDIIVSNGTLKSYYSKGVFKDLTDYLKNDTEVDYDDIFPNLLNACTYDGKIYEIVPSFSIQTLAMKTSLANGMTSWTFDDFINYQNSLPEGSSMIANLSREEFLNLEMSVNSQEFVDTGAGKCYFDTDSFKGFLEYLKTLPKGEDISYDDYDWNAEQSSYREETNILYQAVITDMRSFNYMEQGAFGEDVTLIGYPCAEGNGSSIYFGTSYAISSKCKYPDAAWNIIKKYLSKDYQSSIDYGIPALMSRFDELAEESKQNPYYLDENGEKVEYTDSYYINDVSIEIQPSTDATIEKVKNFILSVDKSYLSIDEINTIITEEAEAFFEGQKTVDEVASIIQSRASIYISEIQ